MKIAKSGRLSIRTDIDENIAKNDAIEHIVQHVRKFLKDTIDTNQSLYLNINLDEKDEDDF